MSGNPVDGVKRPIANGNEGSTPALGDAQARKLLEAPADTRAILGYRASSFRCRRFSLNRRLSAFGESVPRPEEHRKRLRSITLFPVDSRRARAMRG